MDNATFDLEKSKAEKQLFDKALKEIELFDLRLEDDSGK